VTPSARLAAAIEICDGLDATPQPADRFLRQWFAARRYAGSKDRAVVSARVYDMLRHRASFAWRMAGDDGRKLAIASLLSESKSTEDIVALFEAGGHGPKPLSEAERAAIEFPPTGAKPLHVEGEFPAWLEPELTRAFGENIREEMQAMAARAPVDLRVNTLRAQREDVLIGLKSLGVEAGPTPYSPLGIRVPSAEGLNALQQSPFFQTGAFEFQDEASQLTALLCGAKAGARVLDFAAGGGGKALAFAAIMKNKGEIVVYDANPARLKDVGPRARRAGAAIITMSERADDLKPESFDVVLTDAPCSGSGAWRRAPEAKWRLSPERLDDLSRVQLQMLRESGAKVKKGGRLIYATCSVLCRENEDVIAAFLGKAPEFRVLNAAHIWNETIGDAPLFVTENFRASPRASGTDGFFACIMERV
jgi:16S rRNA (cytosine967-C5)-methyltransferase